MSHISNKCDIKRKNLMTVSEDKILRRHWVFGEAAAIHIIKVKEKSPKATVKFFALINHLKITCSHFIGSN